ncbi:cobalamin biosynthesis protein CobD [Natrinema pellirubrum DSM 15624]|uniref:Probable cobalamin biosynthesis protein CobD n=1 Tax=Natrinema pellirubrum (strain DSM 15624 / CIP 106293 / JCM 10476 / NCIMB 786 / 157) TaxID=797303 RepID=L0JI76_NATP1|nr:adenosylcobinamide-phosphate synthase CbiB [Natrinema pellirubrum]AGB31009.1 cobalamin biosynthesis protein CobD [Natrinema pellirubrum DSM 15624]ELY81145.1 cobalamin biosynthesis protein CobD [Natrinema pellirubrum DSM 15624]
MLTTLAVLGLAFSLDLLIGEPPTAVHPVAWFGRLVDATDRNWADGDRGQRLVGVAVAVLTPLVPAAVAGGLVLAVTPLQPMASPVAAALVLFLTTSLRSLLELTQDVVAATDGDPDRARERVRGLVGRDTSTLSPAGLRSAAVESAAENLADGLVATLVPFAVLAPVSLPAAAAAAAWVKGVNTLDSMLGYPSKPIGTASARLDDLVMFLPARLAAVSIAVAALDPLALGRARAWAQTPPSPNSGWPMATLACALGVRLEKVGVYALNPDADLPTLADGQRAVTVVGRAAVVSIVVAVALAAIIATVATPFVPGLEPVSAVPTIVDPAPPEVIGWA